MSSLHELRLTDFRLSLPKSDVEEQRWQVFEGRRWIATVSDRPQHISDRNVEGLGWGAPLVLRTGPYNSCQPEQPLLRGLTNTGRILDVELIDEETKAVISLDRDIKPDASHTLVMLNDLGEMTFIDGTELADIMRDQPTGSVWNVPLASHVQGRRVMALAVSYDGARLGSWWRPDWKDVLRRPDGRGGEEISKWASGLADALRWFRLPLLALDDLPRVHEFARDFAVPVLSTWLCRGELNRLTHDAVGESWLCVVRAIFADWTPSPKEAHELDAKLESSLSNRNDLPLKTTTTALAAVSPLLTARVARAWLADSLSEAGSRKQATALIAELGRRLLGADSAESLVRRVAQDVARSDEPPEGTLDFVRDSLLANCLTLLDQPDSTKVTDTDRGNIEIAMRLDAYRTLVFAACLERISKEVA